MLGIKYEIFQVIVLRGGRVRFLYDTLTHGMPLVYSDSHELFKPDRTVACISCICAVMIDHCGHL